jgi:hypothetical protein
MEISLFAVAAMLSWLPTAMSYFGRTRLTVHEQSRVKLATGFVSSSKNSGAYPHQVFFGKFFAKFDQPLENFNQNHEEL